MIEKQYRKTYNEWKGKDGYLHCSKCKSINVVHVAVANEGDLLICVDCKNTAKIGSEEIKTRKGLRL